MTHTITNWNDFVRAIYEAKRAPLEHGDPIGTAEITDFGDVRRLQITVDIISPPYHAQEEDVPF